MCKKLENKTLQYLQQDEFPPLSLSLLRELIKQLIDGKKCEKN